MDFLWIVPLVLAALILLFLLITWICYCMAFRATDKQKMDAQQNPLPPGEIYLPFHEQMTLWRKERNATKSETFSIRTADGLTLHGNYYEIDPSAPIELMFPGYRGDAERDLCGGMQRCFAINHNALIVDQRSCGNNDGHTITFGIREHKDCLEWVDFMIKHFGPDVRIILTGVSMGAATVLMAAGEPLPKNVIGVLADCGYTSPKEIICKVIRDMHLPAKLLYPFVRTAAKLYGGFDLEENAPIEAVTRIRIPVVFCHGDTDDFVPCEMSQRNYEACNSHKALVIIPGAGHGLCYPYNPTLYLAKLKDFFSQIE